MKPGIILVVLSALVYYCSSTGSISFLTTDCVNYLNNASYEWCRYSTYYTYGYLSLSSEAVIDCVGNSFSRCSTESSYLSNNAKKLLCPMDSPNCNSPGFVSN